MIIYVIFAQDDKQCLELETARVEHHIRILEGDKTSMAKQLDIHRKRSKELRMATETKSMTVK
jgi:hypothetical protein